MGVQAPAGLLAFTPTAATLPADVDKALQAGEPPPAGPSAEERRAYDQLVDTFKHVDYARFMGSRPQTLYGIADSPSAWQPGFLTTAMLTPAGCDGCLGVDPDHERHRRTDA